MLEYFTLYIVHINHAKSYLDNNIQYSIGIFIKTLPIDFTSIFNTHSDNITKTTNHHFLFINQHISHVKFTSIQYQTSHNNTFNHSKLLSSPLHIYKSICWGSQLLVDRTSSITGELSLTTFSVVLSSLTTSGGSCRLETFIADLKDRQAHWSFCSVKLQTTGLTRHNGYHIHITHQNTSADHRM